MFHPRHKCATLLQLLAAPSASPCHMLAVARQRVTTSHELQRKSSGIDAEGAAHGKDGLRLELMAHAQAVLLKVKPQRVNEAPQGVTSTSHSHKQRSKCVPHLAS